MAEEISIEGPVEAVDGRLVLRIPRVAGGAALVPSTQGIARVEGEFLEVAIPHLLGEKFRIVSGRMPLLLSIFRKLKSAGTWKGAAHGH